jgi:hypothetical protein
MSETNPRLVTLKNVRLSFTDSLQTAKATVKDGVPKHGCNILLEDGIAETEANKALVVAALKAAGEQQWQKADKFKVIAEKDSKRVAYRKGERFTNAEDEVYKGYEGAMVIPGYGPGGSKNPKRPVILARDKTPIWHPAKGAENVSKIGDVCYSGTRADVKVEFYPVTGADNGGDGIFATIQLIRSRQEGERMAGGYAVTDADIDDLDDLDSGVDDLDAGDSDFG